MVRGAEGASALLGDDFVPDPTGPAEAPGAGAADLSEGFPGADEDADDVLPAVSVLA